VETSLSPLIGGLFFTSECTYTGPTGEFTALPISPSWLQGVGLRVRERREGEIKGGKVGKKRMREGRKKEEVRKEGREAGKMDTLRP